jgi:hypothetical protein
LFFDRDSFLISQQQDLKHKESIRKKTILLKKTFALPDGEVVSQSYFCAADGINPGVLFITPNYCLFIPNLPNAQNLKIPFRTFRSVEQKKVLLTKTLRIVTETNTHAFSRFVHFDEAYYLLDYVMKHPQVFATSTAGLLEPSGSQENFGNALIHSSTASTFVDGKPSSSSLPRSCSGGQGFGAVQTKEALLLPTQVQVAPVSVNLNASSDAVRRLETAKHYGMDTMNELCYQGDLLNTIENNIETIHHNIGQANIHINGVDSLSGQFLNTMGRGNDILYQQQQFGRQMVNALDAKGPDVVSVLRKKENTNVVPAALIFTEMNFTITEELPNKTKTIIYRYPEVKEIAVRNRSLHIDLRFHNGTRERIISGYSQLIANEITLRSPSTCVTFETHALHFEYGNPDLRERMLKTGKLARANEQFTGSSFLRRRGGGIQEQGSAEVQSASERYRSDLIQQENDVNTINDLLGDLHYMTNAIGQSVDSQNDQVKRVTGRTEEATQRMQATNQRMLNVMNK